MAQECIIPLRYRARRRLARAALHYSAGIYLRLLPPTDRPAVVVTRRG